VTPEQIFQRLDALPCGSKSLVAAYLLGWAETQVIRDANCPAAAALVEAINHASLHIQAAEEVVYES
jgi:hypothetical protein